MDPNEKITTTDPPEDMEHSGKDNTEQLSPAPRRSPTKNKTPENGAKKKRDKEPTRITESKDKKGRNKSTKNKSRCPLPLETNDTTATNKGANSECEKKKEDVHKAGKNKTKKKTAQSTASDEIDNKDDCILELNAEENIDTEPAIDKKIPPIVATDEQPAEKVADITTASLESRIKAVIAKKRQQQEKLKNKKPTTVQPVATTTSVSTSTPSKDTIKPAVKKPVNHAADPISINDIIEKEDMEVDYEPEAPVNTKTPNKQGNNRCSVCSDAPDLKGKLHEINHAEEHISTKQQRLSAKVDDKGRHYCMICKKKHDNNQTRLNIVVANSTLADFEKKVITGNNGGAHFDLVLIKKATLATIKHALIAEYLHENRPIDVLIVAPGIHDVENGDSTNNITRQIEQIRSMILEWDETNTCGLGDLPYPTKLSKIYCSTTVMFQTHIPKAEKSKTIKEINVMISKLNRRNNKVGRNTRKAPGMQFCGLMFNHKGSFMPPRTDEKLKKIVVPYQTLKGRFKQPKLSNAVQHLYDEWSCLPSRKATLTPNSDNLQQYYLAILTYFNTLNNPTNLDSDTEAEDPRDLFTICSPQHWNYYSRPRQYQQNRNSREQDDHHGPSSKDRDRHESGSSGYSSTRPDSRQSQVDSRASSRLDNRSISSDSLHDIPDTVDDMDTENQAKMTSIDQRLSVTVENTNLTSQETYIQPTAESTSSNQTTKKVSKPPGKDKDDTKISDSSDSSTDSESDSDNEEITSKKDGVNLLTKWNEDRKNLRTKLKRANKKITKQAQMITDL